MADVKETSARMLTQARRDFQDDPDDKRRQSILGAATRLHRSAPSLERMIQMARSEPEMSVASPLEFDRNPDLLTCSNGVLDLLTGELRPTRPQDRVSKLAGASFDPDARAPLWEAFLETVLPDQEVREFVRRAVGYTLTGLVDEEAFFVAYGTGANGKSVFANVIAAMLGEFSASFGPELVTRQKHENEAKRADARLPGLRLALVNETQAGDLWDAGRLKMLASRERMSARELYREGFDFMPTAKLWIRTNHLPGSLDAGDGFWRRCLPIPFTEQIPPEKRIPDLDRQIIASELSGVLNWALEGALAWRKGGLQPPPSIRSEVEAYREETDLLGQWLSERTERDEHARVAVAAAFHDYEAFCHEQRAQAGTAMTFSRAMTARGMARDPHKGSGGRRFIGFRLKEKHSQEFEEEADSPSPAVA